MENKTDYDVLLAILKKRLNEKRYYHSLCVADEAKRLAVKYGADPEKAYLAGLLHDITKNAPDEEHLKMLKKMRKSCGTLCPAPLMSSIF